MGLKKGTTKKGKSCINAMVAGQKNKKANKENTCPMEIKLAPDGGDEEDKDSKPERGSRQKATAVELDTLL